MPKLISYRFVCEFDGGENQIAHEGTGAADLHRFGENVIDLCECELFIRPQPAAGTVWLPYLKQKIVRRRRVKP